MKDSSKNKLISVRVTGRMSREIDRLVNDTGFARPDVLRDIIVHGIRSYESALYDRTPDPVSRSIYRRYHNWMLDDEYDETVDAIVSRLQVQFSEVEQHLKRQDEKLENIANHLTKKRGFFR